MKHIIVLFAVLSVTGCGLIKARVPYSGPKFLQRAPKAEQALNQGAITVTALDQATVDQRAAAATPATGGQLLGIVTVGLGSPTEQGFWLSSNLVTVPAKGRVVTATGQSANVDLRPSTGGALLSFSTYRVLGLTLTDLPEVQVFQDAPKIP
jgi:hypothetical protein